MDGHSGFLVEKMIVEVYTSKKEGTIEVVSQDMVNKDCFLEVDSILLRTIEGENWTDCMSKHYELMGWEPYIPF